MGPVDRTSSPPRVRFRRSKHFDLLVPLFKIGIRAFDLERYACLPAGTGTAERRIASCPGTLRGDRFQSQCDGPISATELELSLGEKWWRRARHRTSALAGAAGCYFNTLILLVSLVAAASS